MKKNPYWQKCYAFFNIYLPKTQLIKALHSLDSSRPYERLLENLKTVASRKLFLLKITSKLATQSGGNTDQNGGQYPILGA